MKNIILKHSQKQVLFLDSHNPVQIKGGAGSGKTTVSVFRAKHLSFTQENIFQNKKIIILTYTNALVKELKNIIPHAYAGYEKNSDNLNQKSFGLDVEVKTVHKWATEFLKSVGIDYKFISKSAQRNIIKNFIDELQNQERFEKIPKILKHKIDFYVSEIKFMKGKMLFTLNDYLDSKRIGRGTDIRVTQEDKKVIYEIFLHYENELNLRGLDDFDSVLIKTYNFLKKNNIRNIFSHIVVDEAQDLPLIVFLILKQIISEFTNSITLVGDANQKIYTSGFTWKEVGIDVIGRTVELKENLRTTKKIHRISQLLIANNEDFNPSRVSIPHKNQDDGEYPKIYHSGNLNAQFQKAINVLNSINPKLEDKIAFIHRHNSKINDMFELIKNKNYFSCSDIHPNKNRSFRGKSKINILLSTMHSVKGLNLDYVFIFDVQDGTIPYLKGKEDNSLDFERNLLYVCITRPTKNFFIFTNGGEKSSFIKEIEESKDLIIEQDKDNNINDKILTADDLPF